MEKCNKFKRYKMGLKTYLVFLLATFSILSLIHATTANPRNKIIIYKPWWCDYDYDMGPCTHFQAKYYYDKVKNECRMFVWGGCNGNANKFDDERLCRKVCLLPKNAPPNGF